MPVVVQYTTDVGPDECDEVVSAMRFHDELPEGLIVHTAAITGGGEMRVFDVWQSREAHQRFVDSRLRPAIHEVTGEARADTPAAPEVHQLHSLVKPIRS